jgi:hypothetical protein
MHHALSTCKSPCQVHSFSGASTATHFKYDVLKQRKFISSWFWRPDALHKGEDRAHPLKEGPPASSRS